ncbi:MAG: SUMF1/EgtB/PvdO family nonheme iron enzyme [Spirochaetota bacterium]
MSNEEQPRPEEVEVKLSPVLGVDPTVYVPIVWGALLLVVLFFVLVFPGIKRHGSLVTVVASPPRASFVVDGARMGTAPGTFFVGSGTRTIEVRRPGFSTYRESIDVPGRLVGSWIVPRRMELRVTLTGAEPASLVDDALLEFSDWALNGEASGQYQFPPIARALAADLSAVAPDDGEPSTPGAQVASAAAREAWDAFTRDALAHVASEAQLNDLAGASLGFAGAGSVAVPGGIVATVQRLARTSDRAELFPLQVSKVLAAEREALLAQTPWVKDASARARRLATLALEGGPEVAGAVRGYALGLDFVDLPGGEVVLGGEDRAARGGDLPYRVTLGAYAIGSTEVPFSAWEAFTEANPRWRAENRDALVAEGLVDEDYLAELRAMSANPALPVTGVSAYAAEEFARWYSTLLPDGLQARLPTEAEWAFALRLAGDDAGVFAGSEASGPRPVAVAGGGALEAMPGNVWEWTADPFAAYGFVHADAPARSAAARVVRGGGWATDELTFRPGDRGALDPSWCSTFVGFRLVVSPTGG